MLISNVIAFLLVLVAACYVALQGWRALQPRAPAKQGCAACSRCPTAGASSKHGGPMNV